MPKNPFRREPQDRFDKFTERARKVLQLAQEEAQNYNHDYIGTEHLLLGLVREGDGVAARVLHDLGLDLDGVRKAVAERTVRGEQMVTGEIGLTPEAKRVIELAVDEGRRLNHHYIGTEHLLLGLVREGEGIAANVLRDLVASLEQVRTQVIEVLQASSGYSSSGISSSQGGSLGFDKFTDDARQVLMLAQQEAQRFNHNYIGTEHLLLGLVRLRGSVAANVLNSLGIELHKVRSAVEFIIGRGDRMVMGEIGLTARAKRVIELAVDEARRLNHHYIGTEHLLLGLVREGEGIAAGVLESLGVSLEGVRVQVLRELREPSSPAGTPSLKRTLAKEEPYRWGLPEISRNSQIILRLATEEAARLNHNQVGPEHILLTLIGAGSPDASRVVQTAGLELVKTREAVERVFGKGTRQPADAIDFSPDTRRLIQHAYQLAARFHLTSIEPEHLLLALLQQKDNAQLMEVLSSLNVHPDTLRADLLERLLVAGSGGGYWVGQQIATNVPLSEPDDEDTVIQPTGEGPFVQVSRAEDEHGVLLGVSYGVPSQAGSEPVDLSRLGQSGWNTMQLAHFEAQRLQHDYLGTEHLLLALTTNEEGIPAQVLKALGIDLPQLREAVEFISAKGEAPPTDDLFMAPGAARAFQLAIDEAGYLNHTTVEAEHLLLGLLREGHEPAATVMENFGLSVRQVRDKVLEVLKRNE